MKKTIRFFTLSAIALAAAATTASAATYVQNFDGFADGSRPQHAGLDALSIGVGQRRHRCRRVGDGFPVAEVGERYHARSHQ